MRSLAAKISKVTKFFMFISEFALDAFEYVKYCGVSPFQDGRKKLYYKIIIETHAIEKGLSLAKPRHLFGRQKIAFIVRQVRSYGLGSDDFPILMAVGALQTYLKLHLDAGISDPMLDEIATLLSERSEQSTASGSGGLRYFPQGSMNVNAISHGSADLLLSRYSSRMFADRPIDAETIKKIIHIAQSAPSQCNRQATKVHFYNTSEKIELLLRLQQGSAGFAEAVRGLLVVSFDLAAWGGAQQRNQGYVDAALFSQNVLLAANSLDVATCPLNLAVSHSIERRIRSVGQIPEDQRLVMMIAVGWPIDGEVKAAASPRRPTAEILALH